MAAVTSKDPIPQSIHHGCCTEKRCATITLVAMLAIALIGTIFLISILKNDMGNMTPFFTKVRQAITFIATKFETSPFNVSLFIVVMGGIGLVGALLWRAQITCYGETHSPGHVEVNLEETGGFPNPPPASEQKDPPDETTPELALKEPLVTNPALIADPQPPAKRPVPPKPPAAAQGGAPTPRPPAGPPPARPKAATAEEATIINVQPHPQVKATIVHGQMTQEQLTELLKRRQTPAAAPVAGEPDVAPAGIPEPPPV